ncbi:hypothetical protein BDP81DRAFT_98541 [Colletotrichum phormii]|uniref:Uncharacterized protein n=1 Tax=Colletotrichum phormii TaxID=359342 RepID=A0AAI9ZKS1_9PEZI|nr:uncharacterized protein BDP81DRAFT_98541 [Colletotrichum phormii]KAK1625074.1 hypothetical protein BDP81DRAFT_98541 [Colletotrichum phormii]
MTSANARGGKNSRLRSEWPCTENRYCDLSFGPPILSPDIGRFTQSFQKVCASPPPDDVASWVRGGRVTWSSHFLSQWPGLASLRSTLSSSFVGFSSTPYTCTANLQKHASVIPQLTRTYMGPKRPFPSCWVPPFSGENRCLSPSIRFHDNKVDRRAQLGHFLRHEKNRRMSSHSPTVAAGGDSGTDAKSGQIRHGRR